MVLVWNPMMVISSIFMVVGTMVSVSSSSVMGVWCGMELNMFCFMAVMNGVSGKASPESMVIYFVIQSIGSTLFVIGYVYYKTSSSGLSLLIMLEGLFMKLGVFPFYSWVPMVVMQSRWLVSCLVLSWQKVTPLVLLAVFPTSNFLYLSAVAMAVVGSIGGLNQSTVRGMSSYSSFVHMSWMLVGMGYSTYSCAVYFMFYLIAVGAFFMSCSEAGKTCLSSCLITPSGFVSLLMLSGLPPFSGFLGKFIVLLSCSSWLIVPCVLASVISLKFYISFMYSAVLGGGLFFTRCVTDSVALLSFISAFNMVSMVIVAVALVA